MHVALEEFGKESQLQSQGKYQSVKKTKFKPLILHRNIIKTSIILGKKSRSIFYLSPLELLQLNSYCAFNIGFLFLFCDLWENPF